MSRNCDTDPTEEELLAERDRLLLDIKRSRRKLYVVNILTGVFLLLLILLPNSCLFPWE